MQVTEMTIGHVVSIEPPLCSTCPGRYAPLLGELVLPSSHRDGKLLIVIVRCTAVLAMLFLHARNEDRDTAELLAFGLVEIKHRFEMRSFSGPLHIDVIIGIIHGPVLPLRLCIGLAGVVRIRIDSKVP